MNMQLQVQLCQKEKSWCSWTFKGKTGRVYGNLISLLTVMKGLPLAYNKDTQRR